MRVTRTGPENPSFTHHPGAYVVYERNGKTVIRSWPKKKGGQNVFRQDQTEAFARAVWMARNAPAEEILAARELAQGSPYTWRDILIMSYYGTLFTIEDQNGNLVAPYRLMMDLIQELLAVIGNRRGMVLYRGDGGWKALLPGAEGWTLTAHGEGLDPSWKEPVSDQSLLAEVLLNAASGHFPNGRTIEDAASVKVLRPGAGRIALARAAVVGDVSIPEDTNTATIISKAVTYAKMQDVSTSARLLARKSSGAGSVEEATLSQLLDFVGTTARGDVLFRGTSGWDRLAAGTSGRALTTRGTTGDPYWSEFSAGLGTSGLGAGTPGCFWRDATIYLEPFCGADTASNTQAITANILYQQPVVVPTARTFTSIAMNCSAGVASTAVRLGIYNNAADGNGGPGTLVIDAGTSATATTGVKTAAINQILQPGIYWLAHVHNGAPSFHAIGQSFDSSNCGNSLGAATPLKIKWLSRAFSYAALPSDETAATYTLNGNLGGSASRPQIGIR